MWRLKTISANNICAFREMSYSLLQGHTTLIFGANLDNDSQGSNGSGKSALIEACAIALTGESLRKVNTEEIINDACDSASIVCELLNDSTNEVLVINRLLSRNATQSITLFLNGESIVQPSVAEYNRYILNTLGIYKEDIFSNYILSKHKYTSFLNASDRIKKELINRFSNGNLVDESITCLKTDKAEVQERMFDAEKRVARCEGRVSTITEQIDSIKANEDAKERRKAELIEAHQEAIARLRGKIRQANNDIQESNDRLDSYDEVGDILEELEGSTTNIEDCYTQIIDLYAKRNISGKAIRNYIELSSKLSNKLRESEQKLNDFQLNVESYEVDLAEAAKMYGELSGEYENLQAANTPKTKQLELELKARNKELGELAEKRMSLSEASQKLQQKIAQTNVILSGAIECPACAHKFILNSQYTYEEQTKRLETLQKSLKKANREEVKNNQQIEEAQTLIKEGRQQIAELERVVDELGAKMRSASQLVNKLQMGLDKANSSFNIEKNTVNRLYSQIVALRKNLFDEAFDLLDACMRQEESQINQLEVQVKTYEGNIASYQEAVKELKNTSVSNSIDELESQKTQYEKELNIRRSELEAINSELNELTLQEARFIDFKTHLANSKIEALGKLTNEYLEKIGSDIRIVFSGYTVLKSGKIRDKISISLLRDGIDCGSFAKFSAGEQCRVNLASILALHKLTNANCDDEKGLDLLILDEILDATDEAGLANMFEALNSLQITSMVVSHGQIAESYPYRLTVTKQNGISTINECNL